MATQTAPLVVNPTEPKTANVALIAAGIALVVLGQIYLVFAKSINWDEFLHLSQIHDLRDGRLVWAFQVLHTRIFYWLPLVTSDVIQQVQIARLAMLGFELVTIAAIYGLARLFVSIEAALLTSLAYISGGYVFLHGSNDERALACGDAASPFSHGARHLGTDWNKRRRYDQIRTLPAVLRRHYLVASCGHRKP